jgi:hypothetical protein
MFKSCFQIAGEAALAIAALSASAAVVSAVQIPGVRFSAAG